MSATLEQQFPMILAQVEVVGTERLSPSFVRVELGGTALTECGVDGPLYDQRLKIVFPTARGELPLLTPKPTWYADWLALPDDLRGSMRTYTVREVLGAGADTRLVVDFVLHGAHGHSGPGSSWASTAGPGDRVVVAAPRRGHAYGGIEFDAGTAPELLLAADETAVPALCGILRDLDPAARGVAFAEVPCAADVLPVEGPSGVRVVWLPRDGAPRGRRQVDAVRRHVQLPPTTGLVDERQVDPDLWETPTRSVPAESAAGGPHGTDRGAGLPDVYAWIAGESRVVTTLRRCLVTEAGMHRRQVAFMGYWREGVTMRS